MRNKFDLRSENFYAIETEWLHKYLTFTQGPVAYKAYESMYFIYNDNHPTHAQITLNKLEINYFKKNIFIPFYYKQHLIVLR